jgi:hypothetical protein
MSDERIDVWLREAMADEVPELSSGFDARVLARTRRPTLTTRGRFLMAAYAAGALVLSAWTMRDASPALIAASLVSGGLVALVLSSYVRATSRVSV